MLIARPDSTGEEAPGVVDITERMNEYRECVRHLWNSWFRRKDPLAQDWDARDAFDVICKGLFDALVLRGLDRVSASASSSQLEGGLAPMMAIAVHVRSRCSIMVNRDLAGGYWDNPLDTVVTGDLDLRLIGLFDWCELGFRECGLYRVRIVASERFPSVVGRDALVPAGDESVQVVYRA